MGSRLKSALARATLVGGVALVASFIAKSSPRDQTIVIRLDDRDVTRVAAVLTRPGEREPFAGFTEDFPTHSPRTLRHTLSAPSGTYVLSVTLTPRPAPAEIPTDKAGSPPRTTAPDSPDTTNQTSFGAGAPNDHAMRASPPTLPETSFERRVSLAGGEVIVSPD